VVHVHHIFATTGHATVENALILDLVLSLRETAVGAKHKELDVAMNQILKSIVGMGSIDDRTVSLLVVSSLSSELATKKLVDFTSSPVKAKTDIGNIRNRSLDTIPRTFNLSKDGRHLVTIFRIVNGVGTRDVDNGSSSDRHV
jgi:hypothetical protein